MKTINFLALSWSTSRGQDTYGYNICRLDDTNAGKRYKTIGGGYDMVGTVVANWLQDVFQDELQALALTIESKPYATTGWLQFPGFYGMFKKANGSVILDGACGLDAIRNIANAIGVQWRQIMNKRGREVIGYDVSPVDNND